MMLFKLPKAKTTVIFAMSYLICFLLFIGYYILQENHRDSEYAQGWNLDGAREALKEAPNDPSSHTVMGSVLMKNKQFQQAAQEYQKAVTLKSSDPYAHLNLGNAYAASGQLAKAQSQWKIAVRLDVPDGDAAKQASQALGMSIIPVK